MTYKEVVTQLGYEPDIADILYMTAAKEYFAYVDKPYYNSQGYVKDPKAQNYPKPTVRFTGMEALARSFYTSCLPGELNCEGTQLYKFLSGYEPWCGKAGADNGDPRSRATILIKEGLENNLYGTDDELRDDIYSILTYKHPDWLNKKVGGRPWQWFTTGARFPLQKETFGYAENNGAILAVEAGGGEYLWMLTARQDAKW